MQQGGVEGKPDAETAVREEPYGRLCSVLFERYASRLRHEVKFGLFCSSNGMMKFTSPP